MALTWSEATTVRDLIVPSVSGLPLSVMVHSHAFIGMELVHQTWICFSMCANLKSIIVGLGSTGFTWRHGAHVFTLMKIYVCLFVFKCTCCCQDKMMVTYIASVHRTPPVFWHCLGHTIGTNCQNRVSFTLHGDNHYYLSSCSHSHVPVSGSLCSDDPEC